MNKQKRIQDLKQDLEQLKRHLDFIVQHGFINSRVGLEIQRIEQQIRELEEPKDVVLRFPIEKLPKESKEFLGRARKEQEKLNHIKEGWLNG
jgi:hypothetical protein